MSDTVTQTPFDPVAAGWPTGGRARWKYDEKWKSWTASDSSGKGMWTIRLKSMPNLMKIDHWNKHRGTWTIYSGTRLSQEMVEGLLIANGCNPHEPYTVNRNTFTEMK